MGLSKVAGQGDDWTSSNWLTSYGLMGTQVQRGPRQTTARQRRRRGRGRGRRSTEGVHRGEEEEKKKRGKGGLSMKLFRPQKADIGW